MEVNSHLDLLSCFIDIDMQSTIFPQPDERQVGWTCVQKISINGDEKVTRFFLPSVTPLQHGYADPQGHFSLLSAIMHCTFFPDGGIIGVTGNWLGEVPGIFTRAVREQEKE